MKSFLYSIYYNFQYVIIPNHLPIIKWYINFLDEKGQKVVLSQQDVQLYDSH